MEQILLYIVTISGFSGFMLGLYSLLIPVLQRRGIRLPFAGREAHGSSDHDYEVDDLDTRDFAATSFGARRTSLLERLPGRAAPSAGAQDEDEGVRDADDEELLGDLDLSKERAEVEGESGEDYEEDGLAELTFEAEVDPVLDELISDEELEEDETDEEGEGEELEDGDDEEEYEDEAAEEIEAERPVVHVVSGGGGSDEMMALFEEGSEAAKEVEAWREDLPNPTIIELLEEAQQLRALFRGGRPRA